MVVQATATGAFTLTTNPADYVSRPDTERVLVELEQWVLNGATSSIWITGPPGIGKTLLLKVLVDRLSDRRLCVYVSYPMLAARDLAAWVLDALGEPAGEAPQEAIAALARRHAERGGLVLLVDDAMSMPPATRDTLDVWYSRSRGALRSVRARTGSPSAIGGNEPSGSSGLVLGAPLSLEESRALLVAAMDRSHLGTAARALFDPATIEKIHARTRGIPTRLLIEADRVLFVRGDPVSAGTDAPLLAWGASEHAATEPAAAEIPTQWAVDPAPEPLTRPPLAPSFDNQPSSTAEPPAKPAEQPALLGLILDANPPRDGDRERVPARASRRRRIFTAPVYAGVLIVAALVTRMAIQSLDADPEPNPASLAETPSPARETSVVEIGPGSIEFEHEVGADARENQRAVAGRVAIVDFHEQPEVQPTASAPRPEPDALPSVSAAPPTALAPRETAIAARSSEAVIEGSRFVTEGVIRKGEWLAASFRNHDIPMPILNLINREVGDLFDFTRSQPGHRYTVTLDSAGKLVRFRYVIGSGEELLVQQTGEVYTVMLSSE